jgi:hypothetical protein
MLNDKPKEMEANPPVCPHCDKILELVLDLPYGYWEWDGFQYRLRATATGVDVPEFACANCLSGLAGFHPSDIPSPFDAEALRLPATTVTS